MFRTVPVHFSDRSCHIRRTSFVRVVTDQIIRKETGLRLKTTGHWTATVLVAFPLLSRGAARSVGQKKTPEIIMRVGYPAYFVAMLWVLESAGRDRLARLAFPTAEGMGLRRCVL